MSETMQEDKTKKTSSLEERLKRIEEKKAQLENRKKEILKSYKKQERAKRTRRLIQIGALAEKYFDCKEISPEEFDTLLRNLFEKDVFRDFIEQQTKAQRKTWSV